MTFPFLFRETELKPEDFIRLRDYFSQSVLELVPYARGPVRYWTKEDPAGAVAAGPAESKELQEVLGRQRPLVVAEASRVLLPIWNSDPTPCAVAILENVDPQFVKGLSREWLFDRCRLLSRELRLLKEHVLDPATGLFNGHHLRHTVARLLAGSGPALTLALLEIYPRAKDAEKSLSAIAGIGASLDSYFGDSLLHHLGSGVFGLVLRDNAGNRVQDIGRRVLTWLKREKTPRAHFGYVTIEAGAGQGRGESPAGPDLLFDQAWQALRVAGRRGPYTLCSFSSLDAAASHPLAPLPADVLGKLRRLWRFEDRFALILLQHDNGTEEGVFPGRVLALTGGAAQVVVSGGKEVYAVLAGAGAETALAWARAFQDRVKEFSPDTFSLGIALYPCYGFSKGETAVNARKALLHTGFFGPGTMTLFDAVSLNISGDVYYNQGDLVRAVREYRRGIGIDPDNVNLLNSLGEAYAQMNRHRQALACFERVLTLAPDNHMALFNQGVVSLLLGEEQRAMASLEKALAANQHNGADEQSFDLHLHLGRLYCQAGRHQEALVHLETCHRLCEEQGPGVAEGKKRAGRGLILRCLGEAHKELGRPREAMGFLQRAIRHNPRDAAALSLLGELYANENQGDDIALSLCRQAVELDDGQWQSWCRLGLVQARRGEYQEGLRSLRQGLRHNRRAVALHLGMGRVQEQMGRLRSAARSYRRAVDISPGQAEATVALDRLQEDS
ncbi:MAG: tetratricopeptide repeat protein [Desulfobacterales bacterium]|nr:tetratricopeptide repeat protein [Desulfobacterales bacterium]